MVSFVHSYQMLPIPGGTGIPFHTQAHPIADPYQKHFSLPQRNVVNAAYNQPNTLPLGRFLGTVWVQENQPRFLGANERVVFESSW